MRLVVCLALLGLPATGAVHPVAGQNTRFDRLAAARVQLRAMKFDSAKVLLRQAMDTSGHPARGDLVEAWLLVGVIAFYQGDDSGTASDFRRALALDPMLKADGLARYDSALVVLFNAQRSVAVTDTTAPGTRTDVVVDCAETCPDDVALPRMFVFPPLEGLPPDFFEIRHDRYGFMIVQFIVDSAGRVAPASLEVVSSNLQMKPLERALLGALTKARFTPPHAANGQPIAVLVRGKMGFRIGRFEAEVPVHPRRRPH